MVKNDINKDEIQIGDLVLAIWSGSRIYPCIFLGKGQGTSFQLLDLGNGNTAYEEGEKKFYKWYMTGRTTEYRIIKYSPELLSEKYLEYYNNTLKLLGINQ